MPQPEALANRWPTALKTAALSFVFGGFTLELLAVVLNSWSLFKFGLFLFIIGVPCYLFGLLFGCRS